MPLNSTDRQIQKNYKLVYFKRNFKQKIANCLFWNLDKKDIELMIKSWKLKAEEMGTAGIERYEEVIGDIEKQLVDYHPMPGRQWKEILLASGLRSK